MDLLFNLEPTAWSRNFDDEEIEELEFQAPKPIEFKVRLFHPQAPLYQPFVFWCIFRIDASLASSLFVSWTPGCENFERIYHSCL